MFNYFRRPVSDHDYGQRAVVTIAGCLAFSIGAAVARKLLADR